MNVTIEAQVGSIDSGKNFNIFRTATTSSLHNTNNGASSISTPPMVRYEYYLQTHPAPHKYRKMTITKDLNSWNVFKNASSPKTKNRRETAPGGLPNPTFDTPDTPHNVSICRQNPKAMSCDDPVDVPFFEMDDDHGTACCVRVTLPSGKEVMVGIAHKKLSQRTNFWLLDVHKRYRDFGVDQFVSRFIAYDVRHPFTVVARSGWFCLGFASQDESSEVMGNRGSTLAGTNRQASLGLFGGTFNCPGIHFVSGFSETVGNRSRAIIGYGINDCHPRVFFVEKEEVARLLTMTQ